MKKLSAILFCCTIALATTALAKQENKNKNAPKTKPAPVHVQKQQHLNAGPKVQHNNNVPKKNEFSKSTHVQSQELKTNKAPKLDKNITPNTNVVANDKLRKNVKTATLPKEKIDRIRAQHLNFKAHPNPKIASVHFNQNYRIAGAQNWTRVL